jgi:ABC-type branched-subunit amino acid transport system substrate-binding protein
MTTSSPTRNAVPPAAPGRPAPRRPASQRPVAALLSALLLAGCAPGASSVRPDGRAGGTSGTQANGAPEELKPADPFQGRSATVKARQDPAADAALAKADQQAKALQGAKAADVYLSVRKTHPETTAGQEALYRAGVQYFEAKEYVRARKAFNELLFENPLFDKATDAKYRLGLSTLETGSPREAYQMLAALSDGAQGAEKEKYQEATRRAAEAAGVFGDALQMAVDEAGRATTAEAQAAAVARVTELVEGRASFVDVLKVYEGLSTGNPAWPTLAFKLGRIYHHLRDFDRMQQVLDRLVQVAPQHPYTERAQTLLARAQPKPIKAKTVGVLLPMSGKYKQVGEVVMRGIKLGLAGSDIDVVVKDTKAEPMEAGKAVEDLYFEQGAIAAIGPLLGDESRRAALVAEELGLPLVTMTRSEDITDIGPFIFRNMLTYSDQARALADYATKELGFKRFAMLYPNIPYGTDLANAFWDEVEQRGAEVRGAETYSPDQTSFGPEVKKLVGRYYLEDRQDYQQEVMAATEDKKDAFRRRKAIDKVKDKLLPIVDFDALFMPGDWQSVGLIAPALAVEDVITNACDPKDLERIKKTTGRDDIRTVTLLGTDGWKSPKSRTTGLPMLLERGGKFVTCSVYVDGFFAESQRPATKKFVDAFQGANPDVGREPLLLEAVGYDIARMIRQVVAQAKPKDRAGFRDALSEVRNFDGATGTTSFNDQREAVKTPFYIGVDAKGVQELQPKFLEKSAAKSGS